MKSPEQWDKEGVCHASVAKKIQDNVLAALPKPAHASEPIICPYCQIEQETIGGFIAHLKLLHPAHASEPWTQQHTSQCEIWCGKVRIGVAWSASDAKAIAAAHNAAIEKATEGSYKKSELDNRKHDALV